MQDEFNPDPDEEYYNTDPDEEYCNTDDPTGEDHYLRNYRNYNDEFEFSETGEDSYYDLPPEIRQNKTLKEQEKASRTLYEVIRVVDGDTIKIEYEGLLESVRFIGVDTPELDKPGGQRAAEFTRSLISGKYVYLVFSGRKRDIFKRLLAYVYRSDGLSVTHELIRRGYGCAVNSY